jgi:hypothetical protein
MKYIITENQKDKTFQKLIDLSISSLRDKCNKMDELGAESEEIVNFEACDQLNTTSDVKIVNFNINNGIIILFLDFYTESIVQNQSIDNLIWELKYEMEYYVGKNTIKLVHNDTIHNKINTNW